AVSPCARRSRRATFPPIVRRLGTGVGHTPDRGGPAFDCSKPGGFPFFLRQKVWTSQAKCLMMPSDILFEDGLDHGAYLTRRYRHGAGDPASAVERRLGDHPPPYGSPLPARKHGTLRDGAKTGGAAGRQRLRPP